MTQQSYYQQQQYGSVPQPRPQVSPPVTGWVLLVAGVLAIVGSVTPWASISIADFRTHDSVSGADGGDGVITIVCAIAVLVTGLLIGIGQGQLWTSIVALSAAAVIGIVALIDISNITSQFRSASDLPGVEISVGFGLWLTAAAAWLAFLVSIVALSIRRIR